MLRFLGGADHSVMSDLSKVRQSFDALLFKVMSFSAWITMNVLQHN
jgi:hypothetical protein